MDKMVQVYVKIKQLSYVKKFEQYLSNCLIFSQISCFSSRGNKLGTSPAFNKLLISSKKDSCLIYKKLKKIKPTVNANQ